MSAASPVSLLFVYGSLRPGSRNPHAVFLLARCRAFGPATMPGRLFRNGTHFAALHEPESDNRVLGDVMELPSDRAVEMLTSLDRYEGIGAGLLNPPSYNRAHVPVILTDGTLLTCWAWLWNLPVNGMKHVRHGDALKAINGGAPKAAASA